MLLKVLTKNLITSFSVFILSLIMTVFIIYTGSLLMKAFVTYSLMITVFVAYYHLEESQFGENFEHHIGLTSTE